MNPSLQEDSSLLIPPPCPREKLILTQNPHEITSAGGFDGILAHPHPKHSWATAPSSLPGAQPDTKPPLVQMNSCGAAKSQQQNA